MAFDPGENKPLTPEEQDMIQRFGPNPKDTLERSKPKQQTLKEKDFIKDEMPATPSPTLLWISLFAAVILLAWGGYSWFMQNYGTNYSPIPFANVTNRDFSLFLWQNPEFMRVNKKIKVGYLPAFGYLGDMSLDPEMADYLVVAPADVLFRYHAWNRLVGKEFSQTPIPVPEFIKFLDRLQEWNPKNWRGAPAGYVEFVKNLPDSQEKDLSKLPEEKLPLIVRQAFQGWNNYFHQGVEIEAVSPTNAEMTKFLEKHPHYARNYWRNIVRDVRPNYLRSFSSGKVKPEDGVPKDERISFLNVAVFNFLQQKP